MKYSKFLVLSLSVFLLVSCGSKKETNQSAKDDKKVVVKTLPSSNNKEIDNTDLVNDFVDVYFNQTLDISLLEEKEMNLREYVDDSSLESMLSEIATLKHQIEYYKKLGEDNTNFTSLYVNKKLKSVDIYSNGALYLIDVEYEETSPVYVDGMTYRGQYTFKIENNKIYNFKELP